ncbi:MAG: beta-ketoacyl-ACP synthase 3 [Spirochaetia bacterium]
MGNTAIPMPTKTLLPLYRYMVTARELDLIEEEYTSRGEAFFHVSGAGHEASVMLQPHLTEDDWLHCHYRDKALMLARGISPEMFFMSLFNKDGSHSRGRQMIAHMSSPEHKILSLVGAVGSSALQSAGVASVVKDQEAKPIVLCGLGDGMTQQGEVLEGIAQAVRDTLPVLFLIQDNSLAISTKTKGRTFYSTPSGEAESFYGIPVRHVDGRNPVASYHFFGEVVAEMRETRAPAIAVLDVDRLSSHTNADDQRIYRSTEEIQHIRDTGDPVAAMRNQLIEDGMSSDRLEEITGEIREELRQIAHRAQRSPEPKATFTAVKPLPVKLTSSDSEYTGNGAGDALTMVEAIREVLKGKLDTDDRVVLFGEDLEDPKGDVFGITRGLTDSYPGRVINSPLAEATIVGMSVGRALAGERPVAFLQFADFLPMTYNQIYTELGSMYWRTDGGWQAPVIVMVTTGAYKPGLGPFHAAAMEGIAAHTPGVDVFMPSTAGDAAGLLNAAFESGRPTIFFYPKICLNDRSATTSPDVTRQLVPIGRARRVRSGEHITLVGWGNTVRLCRQAAESLDEVGVTADVIDLRSIVPWDVEMVLESAQRTGRLIVVHEDNRTAGMGAEVVATVAERATLKIDARRVTRGDTYVPCNFGNQLEVLPSYKRILETAVEMIRGSILWKLPEGSASGIRTVEAIGASPSDESVTVVAWHVQPEEDVTEGQLIAELEADKAAFEFMTPAAGTITELLCGEGDTVKIGAPLFNLKTVEGEVQLEPITREDPGTPLIEIDWDELSRTEMALGGGTASTASASGAPEPARSHVIGRDVDLVAGIANIAARLGSRIVTNEEISAMCPAWSPEDIVKRTGIETRHWLGEGENALTLATDAGREVLAASELLIDDIDVIICSTGTPLMATPSMATMIHYELAGERDTDCAAFDISAACSGYIYGLQIAYDHLQSQPGARILLVTTETLSLKLDTSDPSTAPVFADGATASIIVGADNAGDAQYKIFRPVLGSQGEPGSILTVPITDKETIVMDGPVVYQAAVRSMIVMLKRACHQAHIPAGNLDLIVPHQANQRIINAVRQRMKVDPEKVFSNIRDHGNTSSCTIPICLSQLSGKREKGELFGLTAFGGGFTYAGGLLQVC